jgi:tRNA(Ile)-lysidine synthase
MYHRFLKIIAKSEGRVLVALSGGVDSMLLYYFLKRVARLELHIVHVDHKWTSTSSDIAESLRRMVQADGHTFHLHTIENISKSEANVEDRCRIERIEFFRTIYNKVSAKALFLGHHADDQVELVLKRLFEGSYVTNCSGMRKKQESFNMHIYRPFLEFKKKEILAYAMKDKVLFFEDPSNTDIRFLRARFRQKLMAEIRSSFGKAINNSVLHISTELSEIQEFLENDFFGNQERIRKCETHISYDIKGLAVAQLRFGIKQICKDLGESINREQMRIILESIEKNRSKNRAILSRHEVILIKKTLNFVLINRVQASIIF